LVCVWKSSVNCKSLFGPSEADEDEEAEDAEGLATVGDSEGDEEVDEEAGLELAPDAVKLSLD